MTAVATGLPSPRMPKVAPVTSVDQILPNVREIVRREEANMYEGMRLEPGEKVLALTDTTINPLIIEALNIAVKDAGGRFELISLEGYPDLKEPVDLCDAMFSKNWYPDWVWDAANQSDVFVHLAMLKLPHTPNHPLKGKKHPKVVGWELSIDVLASDYIVYPIELRDAIGKKTWDTIFGGKEVVMTDPLGTDLHFKLTADDWVDGGGRIGGESMSFKPGHLMLPMPPRDVEGTLATTAVTFGGPIPKTTLTLERRQVVKVEGGGLFGERLKETFEKYKDKVFPGMPGPGANFLSTFGLCTNPKARPSVDYDKVTGSARIHAWTTGHRRSGIIHTAIGMGMDNPKYKVCRHVDVQFPTLYVDKELIIDRGHLSILDDPEIRALAAKFGDPDQLLTEDWIPAVIG